MVTSWKTTTFLGLKVEKVEELVDAAEALILEELDSGKGLVAS
jgi:hypothetical protein